MRPTGNCRPALLERLTDFFLVLVPLPRPDILLVAGCQSTELGCVYRCLPIYSSDDF